MSVKVLALVLVQFTTPNGQHVYVNPNEVATVREPRAVSKDYIAEGTNCVLIMTNGNIVSTIDDCDTVDKKLLGDIK